MMAIRKLCVMPLWHYPLWHPNLKLHLLNFDCCHLFVCFFQLGHYEFRRHRWPTSSSMWIKVGPCYGPTIIYQMNMMLRYKGLSNERVRSMRSQIEWEVGQFSYRPCRPFERTQILGTLKLFSNWKLDSFYYSTSKEQTESLQGPSLVIRWLPLVCFSHVSAQPPGSWCGMQLGQVGLLGAGYHDELYQ